MFLFLNYETKEENRMYSFLNYGTNEKEIKYSIRSLAMEQTKKN